MQEINLINSEDKYYNEINTLIEKKDNNKALLSNIKSNYILKTIFSYLKYNYILKLIKNNKSLQNKLGINKQNYKDYSDLKYESMERTYKIYSGFIEYDSPLSNLDFISLFTYLFLFLLICYSIIVNIIQRKYKISFVNKVNISSVGLIAICIILICCLKKRIHVFVLLFFNLFNISFEILLGVKMYKIAKINFSFFSFFFGFFISYN